MYHIAQLNFGKVLYPTDDPRIAEFIDALDRINALADSSPGFVWRLQDDSGNATSITIFDDPFELINMSVWESIEELQAFSYRTEHVEFFRRRHEWFEPAQSESLVLWWIKAGDIPTPQEGRRRLELLRANGPTPEAFTFKERFPAPQRRAG